MRTLNTLPCVVFSSTIQIDQAHPFYETEPLVNAEVVDISFKPSYIYVVARSNQNIIASTQAPRIHGIKGLHQHLSPEVQRRLGSVMWPTPNELFDLVDSIQTGTVLGVSDGSVRPRDGRASYAWILQAPNGSEISGRGSVDGSNEARTSHRAELQGQTTLFVILSLIVRSVLSHTATTRPL